MVGIIQPLVLFYCLTNVLNVDIVVKAKSEIRKRTLIKSSSSSSSSSFLDTTGTLAQSIPVSSSSSSTSSSSLYDSHRKLSVTKTKTPATKLLMTRKVPVTKASLVTKTTIKATKKAAVTKKKTKAPVKAVVKTSMASALKKTTLLVNKGSSVVVAPSATIQKGIQTAAVKATTVVSAPMASPTSTTSTTTTSELQPDDLPIRINAGYTAGDWIDPVTKLNWYTDTSYDEKSSFAVVENFCGGRSSFWCSYRHGAIVNYSFPVLKSRERYKITLFFDEPMFSINGSRLFDVYVEGVLMRSDVDPYSLAGGKNMEANITIAMIDTVKDGVLDIILQAKPTARNGIQKALLNGIIVEVSPYRLQSDFPLRINSGTLQPWTDPITGIEWLSDTDYNRPTLAIDACSTSTTESKLYCTYRMGEIINYAIRVLDSELRYKVTFYMEEPSFLGPGNRLMDLFIENEVVKERFDIIEFVGERHTPTSFTITTDKIKDGVIDIKIKSSSGKAKTGQRVIVSGIMVERA